MTPIPVLLVAQQLVQGGSERQLTEVARALDRRRFTPHVAVFRPGGMRFEELRALGVPLAVFPFGSFFRPGMLRAAVQLRTYVRQHRIALVHPFDTPGALVAVPAARAAGAPVVLSSQRTHRELLPGTTRRLLRLTDRMVDGIVANCQMIGQHLTGDEGVPPGKIHICYNGIDLARFAPSPRLRQPGLAGASLVVGVVCALRPEKDLLTLLEAFAPLAAADAGARLVFVGDGPMRTPLQERSQALGLEDRVLLVPSTSEVAKWLRSMDIFVLPSKSEALSNALMEAMACGCTAVASRVGGNGELVEDGVTGLLFPVGDVAALGALLRRLAADAAERERLVAAALGFVQEKLTLAASVARMEEIYREMLGRHGVAV